MDKRLAIYKLRIEFDRIINIYTGNSISSELNNHLWNWVKENATQIDKLNQVQEQDGLKISQRELLAEIINHVHYCPFGYDDKNVIIRKRTTNEEFYNWIKKLHELNKEASKCCA